MVKKKKGDVGAEGLLINSEEDWINLKNKKGKQVSYTLSLIVWVPHLGPLLLTFLFLLMHLTTNLTITRIKILVPSECDSRIIVVHHLLNVFDNFSDSRVIVVQQLHSGFDNF